MSEPISDEPLDVTVENSGQRESAVSLNHFVRVFDSLNKEQAMECARIGRLLLEERARQASMRSRVLSAPSTEGPQAEQEKS